MDPVAFAIGVPPISRLPLPENSANPTSTLQPDQFLAAVPWLGGEDFPPDSAKPSTHFYAQSFRNNAAPLCITAAAGTELAGALAAGNHPSRGY